MAELSEVNPSGRQRGRARPRLSERLRRLAAEVETNPRALIEFLSSDRRGHNLVLIVLCLPFLVPIPVPVLSTLVGTVVAFIGFRLLQGKRPRWPARWSGRQLPTKFVSAVMRVSGRVLQVLEYALRPRWRWLHQQTSWQRLGAAIILCSGVQLLLPLPIPFSNFLPASTIVLLAASAIEQDGLAFLGAGVLFALSSAFFAILAFGGAVGLHELWQWMAA